MSEGPATGSLDEPGDARTLLDAVLEISSELDLDSVLRRIVESACAITGAQHGVLGVLGPDGLLGDFVVHEIPGGRFDDIDAMPRGPGVAGSRAQDPRPLRLEQLAGHLVRHGSPDDGPAMVPSLRVPVHVRGQVFGDLYLERERGEPFVAHDRAMVEALADAAGLMVANAQAYAVSERRRRWLEAAARVSEALQAPIEVEEALTQVVIGARKATGAEAVALLQQRGDGHEVAAADGSTGSTLQVLLEGLALSVQEAEESGEVKIVPQPGGSIAVVPVRAQLAGTGVLLVVLGGGPGVLEAEEHELLTYVAAQAAMALDRVQALADRHELLLLADRERIARDLHDLVIQRIFATGLQLQGVHQLAVNDLVSQRIKDAVVDLDTTIRDIRSTIFELQSGRHNSLRSDINTLVREYLPVLGFTPLVRTAGPLDTLVSREAGEQVLATLREALSNVVQHAVADACVVEISADTQWLRLCVTDNGCGIPDEVHESGLRNVRRRAMDLGGTCQLLAQEPHGARLEWTVPIGS